MQSPILLTMDIDWAPDFMLDELHQQLKGENVAITFFCTHDSAQVRKLISLPGCETALHPNLHGSKDEASTLQEIHRLFPGAVGLRLHRLYYHSGLLALMHQQKLQYLSNDLCFLQENLQPSYDWAGIVRLPIFWEDDVHCVYFTERFQLDALSLNRPGIKVFNFHPVHCYLNTQDFQHYQKVKDDLHDLKKAVAAKQSGQGTQSLFLALLQEIRKIGGSSTLSKIATDFQQQQPYQGQVRNWLRQQSPRR